LLIDRKLLGYGFEKDHSLEFIPIPILIPIPMTFSQGFCVFKNYFVGNFDYFNQFSSGKTMYKT